MLSSAYSFFVHKPIYPNLMQDHTTMQQSIMAGIHEVETKLNNRIGNKQLIFQIQYVI